MKETIKLFNPAEEFYIEEGCYITEISNSPDDPDLSIARARVEPGVRTHWHYLENTAERYVITSGQGRIEIGTQSPQTVRCGDVVIIPAGCRQRICNTGQEDLLFLALCSPRFNREIYRDMEN